MNKRQKKKSIKKKIYFNFYKCSSSLFPSYYSNYKKIRAYLNMKECHDKQIRKVKGFYKLQFLPRNIYKL